MLASPSASGGLLDHLDQPPRLASRERPAGGDGHQVADVGLAVLIVSEELGRAPHVLAVPRVLDQPLDLDGDRLLHLVADDTAREGTRALGLGRRCGVGLVGAHLLTASGRTATGFADEPRTNWLEEMFVIILRSSRCALRAGRSSRARCCAALCRTGRASASGPWPAAASGRTAPCGA